MQHISGPVGAGNFDDGFSSAGFRAAEGVSVYSVGRCYLTQRGRVPALLFLDRINMIYKIVELKI